MTVQLHPGLAEALAHAGKYEVIGPDGECLTRLDSGLAQRQQVTDEQRAALILSHQLKHVLFEGARAVIAAGGPARDSKLLLLAEQFAALEAQQQRLWNFKVDKRYNHFFDFPGCTCPKLDNAERVGTDYTITAHDCPLHGAR